MVKKNLLKDYICAVPFTSIEIHDHQRFLCCASWLTKFLPENTKPYDAWNSEEANDIRDSILDGSYRYCDHNHCPFIHQLKTFGDVGRVYPLYHKDKLSSNLEIKIKKAEQAIHQFIEEAFDQNGFKQVEHQPNLHDGCKWCPFFKTFHCSATYHTH